MADPSYFFLSVSSLHSFGGHVSTTLLLWTFAQSNIDKRNFKQWRKYKMCFRCKWWWNASDLIPSESSHSEDSVGVLVTDDNVYKWLVKRKNPYSQIQSINSTSFLPPMYLSISFINLASPYLDFNCAGVAPQYSQIVRVRGCALKNVASVTAIIDTQDAHRAPSSNSTLNTRFDISSGLIFSISHPLTDHRYSMPLQAFLLFRLSLHLLPSRFQRHGDDPDMYLFRYIKAISKHSQMKCLWLSLDQSAFLLWKRSSDPCNQIMEYK